MNGQHMILHYEQHQMATEQPVLVFIHGLFGSLSNLGMLARAFYETHHVIQIDVRNHGKSSHCAEMNYDAMAQDLIDTLAHLNIEDFSVIAHSMGGKIAMTLAHQVQQRLKQLIILDMSPFAYQKNHHDQIFKALFAVKNAQVQTRQDAMQIMRQHLNEEMVIQFLMKSFSQGQWLFNVDALFTHYADILSWQPQPAWKGASLFLRGEKSPYISAPEHFSAIDQQFPMAEIQVIEQAGHWLHAEKTALVLTAIQHFLAQ